MATYKMPDAMMVGFKALRVKNIEKVLTFYEGIQDCKFVEGIFLILVSTFIVMVMMFVMRFMNLVSKVRRLFFPNRSASYSET